MFMTFERRNHARLQNKCTFEKHMARTFLVGLLIIWPGDEGALLYYEFWPNKGQCTCIFKIWPYVPHCELLFSG